MIEDLDRWALGLYTLLFIAAGVGLRRRDLNRRRPEDRPHWQHVKAEQPRGLARPGSAGVTRADRVAFRHPILHPTPVELERPDDRFLEEVRAVIEARMADEAFCVEELARRVAHSRGHLHRRLKELAGESPSDLIRRMRLERAACLLESRAGSVSRIAHAVGFKSAAHFSNRFHEHFGVRPSGYPESRWTPGGGAAPPPDSNPRHPDKDRGRSS